jgi:AraC-like DNA-binding protein
MIDLREIGVRDVPLVGVHHLSSAEPGLSRHVHEGLMEICYLKRGERVYCVGGKDYRFTGNEVFITFPDEEHGSGNNPHGKGILYWMQVRLPKRASSFVGLTSAEAGPLVKSLRSIPRRIFRGDHRLETYFDEIRRLYFEGDGPLRRLAIESRVVSWLIAIVECANGETTVDLSDDIRRAIEEARRYPGRTLSVSDLARAAKLSTSRFKAKFKEQTGMAPAEYVLRERVGIARGRLASGGGTVTEIAYDLGFSSSQYFATVFKRFTGLRPTDVRKSGGVRSDAPLVL